MKKTLKYLSITFCIVSISAILLYTAVLHIAPFPYEAIQDIKYSKCLFDSKGNLLRAFTNEDGLWLMPVELKDINPHLIQATLSIEDNRFNRHFGVDPFAVIRSANLNLRNGRIISGASTISMQVIRILENRDRSFPNKIIESAHAIKLERLYSKGDILNLYFEIAPYGGNIHGVRAASLRYFKKHPKDLTLSECALLAGIPQSPTRLRPNLYPERAQIRRQRVLESMLKNGYITLAQYETASNEPVSAGNNVFPFKVPHFAQFVHSRYHEKGDIKTTIDPGIQFFAEHSLKEAVNALAPHGVTNGAVVVLENKTGSIRAMVGSVDFFSKANSGQINGTLSKRCPGSTLKPFTYALGFDKGIYTPKMLLSDTPIQYNGYAPLNYDRKFRGPVTVQEALVDSLNVPAVEVSHKIGHRSLYGFLRNAGITTLNRLPDHYGLALTLGAGEVNLLELTNAYATLARLGEYMPYTPLVIASEASEASEAQSSEAHIMNDESKGVGGQSQRRILSDGACYLIADILSDTKRLEAIGIYRDDKLHPKFAWKTGTSYGNKDAWTILYNPEYTIGIWLGNFSARPSKALVGVNAAAPIGVKIFDWLYLNKSAPWYQMPNTVDERRVCAISGEPVSASCENSVTDLYIRNRSTTRRCTTHEKISIETERVLDFDRDRPRIISPAHRCEYFITNMDAQAQKLPLAGTSDSGYLYWFINGRFYGKINTTQKLFWPMEKGTHQITCSDIYGKSSTVNIIVR
jgi:penicillin-binding protein 1C